MATHDQNLFVMIIAEAVGTESRFNQDKLSAQASDARIFS